MYRYKNSKKIIFKKIVLIFLMMLPIVGIAFVCNNVVARYSGSLKQNLTFIAYPNNAYNFYIYDNSGGRTGAYNSASSITQDITIRSTPKETIYQIKLPASEEGYYQLSFMVDFLKNGSADTTLDMISTGLGTVGCKVVHEDQYPFGKTASTLTMTSTDSTVSTNGIRVSHASHPLWEADDNYMWKTLAPSLAERVDLTYKVTSDDVDNGYVIWAWEFLGLVAQTKYTITLTEIDIIQLDKLDSDRPHFNFTQTQYVNNTINASAYSATYGYTRNAPAKGTYVTSATTDSMTMQVAPLYADWDTSSDQGLIGGDDSQYENLVGLNIPLKNIEYDTSYKVSFDFSIARQGNVELDANALAADDVLYSSAYQNFFWTLSPSNNARTVHFQSYLHSGAVSGRAVDDHLNGRAQITLDDVRYPNHEVTRYDEFRQLTNGTSSNDFYFNSGITINSLTNSSTEANNIRFFNAVRHEETNGQNQIYWYTFYNTTFTFNISSTANASKNLNLDDLYWVWGIDSLYPGRWFRIKIDNARIEEVEQYGSNINRNGIRIAGARVSDFNYYNTSTQTEETYLRGANGTGQNYQALQGTTRRDGSKTPDIAMTSINTYGPIYDASDHVMAVGAYDSSGKSVRGINDYKIYLDGYCVVKGGVDKYVWSADGGKTWYDMVVETPLGEADIETLAYAERRVDQAQRATFDTKQYYARYPSYFDSTQIDESIGADGYRIDAKDNTNDYVDFVQSDAENSVFTGFRIYADISKYAQVWDLDVIFAAVPKTNSNARCELIRITNLNQGHSYRSLIQDISSDIQVASEYGIYGDSATTKYLNATYNYASGTTTWAQACYAQPFNKMRGIAYGVGATVAHGYSSLTNPKSIKAMMPLMSGVAIKGRVRIKGWNICDGGTEGYYWSIDNGITWNLCSGSALTSTTSDTNLSNQAKWWMNNKTLTSNDVINSLFLDDSSALTIDLSEYEGKVVNVIVAAKPIGNAQFCPVAKINSVAIQGDRIFYTRIAKVKIDGTEVLGIVGYDQLNMNTTILKDGSYSSFEPYNVDLFAARKITDYAVDVTSGTSISLDGFILCKGGVKNYQYTLDGGETWTAISMGDVTKGTQIANAAESILHAAALVDIDLDASAGVNGNFRSPEASLTFNLPTFSESKKYDLLLVAVANDGNETMYPVLHMDINVID